MNWFELFGDVAVSALYMEVNRHYLESGSELLGEVFAGNVFLSAKFLVHDGGPYPPFEVLGGT